MHHFEVRAAFDPQALPRIVGQLARQWVAPTALTATLSDDELLIDFVTTGLERHAAEWVEGALRSCVLVHAVDVREVEVAGAESPE